MISRYYNILYYYINKYYYYYYIDAYDIYYIIVYLVITVSPLAQYTVFGPTFGVGLM
jgi:hypothetical protein